MIRVTVQPEQLEGESGSEDGTTAAGETSDKKNQVEAELRRECSTDEILAWYSILPKGGLSTTFVQYSVSHGYICYEWYHALGNTLVQVLLNNLRGTDMTPAIG